MALRGQRPYCTNGVHRIVILQARIGEGNADTWTLRSVSGVRCLMTAAALSPQPLDNSFLGLPGGPSAGSCGDVASSGNVQ